MKTGFSTFALKVIGCSQTLLLLINRE